MSFRAHRMFFRPLLILLLSLCFLPSAQAAERTRRPVEALPVLADGSGLIYQQVIDFREIASRLALSNAARCLSILDREFAGFFELLRRWPCESMTFFSGEELRESENEATYIVAAYPDAYRSLLKKVELGIASGRDAAALFVGLHGSDADEEDLRVSVDDGNPYRIRCGGFRLNFTARDNLLIGAFREGDLEWATAALASGRHFTPGKSKSRTRNFVVFEAGESLTRALMREIFYTKLADENESLRVEADFAFEPDGWKLDVRSNLVALMKLPDTKKTGDAAGSDAPFERLGGGRLVAASSVRSVSGVVLFELFRGVWEANLRNMDSSVFREFLSPAAGRFMGVERIDGALIFYPGETWPDGFGAYSVARMPDRERAAKLKEEALRRRDEFAREMPYTELASDRWKPLYAVHAEEEGIASRLLFGYADDAFLYALLPEAGFEKPFETDRAYFEQLAAKPGDFIYADLRSARTAMKGMREGVEENIGQRRTAGEFFLMLLALASDIDELSVTNEREGAATVRARTARPDIDERMWLYELLEEIR